jgi:tight adherence protein B
MENFALVSKYIQSILLMLLPVAGMMLVIYSGWQLYNDLRQADRKKLRDRMREDRMRARTRSSQQSILRNPHSRSVYEKMVEKISLARTIQKLCVQADFEITGAKLLGILLIVAAALFGLTMLVYGNALAALGVAAMAVILPLQVVKFLAARRINKLVNQLPDVFELLGQALRAGHALASGVQLVGQQLPDPAGGEFARIFHEQNLGIKIEEALKNFSDRSDQLDIKLFVTAVLIQRQTGGDLSEVLDKISNVIRERIKLHGQVKALTAEGRMSGWVLGVMPFFVFFLAWMLNPNYANILLYEKEGQGMLIGALIMQIMGALMIKKIIKIRV